MRVTRIRNILRCNFVRNIADETEVPIGSKEFKRFEQLQNYLR